MRSLVAGGRSVKEACRVAGIPRCSYYRARKRSRKAESDEALVRVLCDIENDRHVSLTYGVERLTGEVNRRLRLLDGPDSAVIMGNRRRVNRKRVHRLMKLAGIHARIRRRTHPDGYYKAVREALKANRAPNLLDRQFVSGRPMRKLSTDVTYIPCRDQKFLYLSPLFDLFNNEIVAYSMSVVNSGEFVARMLTVLPKERLSNILLHSDQGSVYWSKDWVELCGRLGITRSMSRRGNCWDNAKSEGFFSAMKSELGLTKRVYRRLLPVMDVKDLVCDYVPWYNNGRIQKRLGFLAPAEFRQAFLDRSVPQGVLDGLGMSNG